MILEIVRICKKSGNWGRQLQTVYGSLCEAFVLQTAPWLYQTNQPNAQSCVFCYFLLVINDILAIFIDQPFSGLDQCNEGANWHWY